MSEEADKAQQMLETMRQKYVDHFCTSYGFQREAVHDLNLSELSDLLTLTEANHHFTIGLAVLTANLEPETALSLIRREIDEKIVAERQRLADEEAL